VGSPVYAQGDEEITHAGGNPFRSTAAAVVAATATKTPGEVRSPGWRWCRRRRSDLRETVDFVRSQLETKTTSPPPVQRV